MVLSEAEFLAHAARDDLSIFIPLVMTTEDGSAAAPPKHLAQYVIPALVDDSLGPTVIIAPPGSAKTMTAIAACAWWIGRDPSTRMAYICNEGGAAMERSTVLQNIIENSQYQGIFRVEPDKQTGWSKTEWYVKRPSLTDKNPTMTAVGWTGGIVGNRLDRAIIDDVADLDDMYSESERKKLVNFLEQTLMPRFLRSEIGRPVMIGTRLHEDDPCQWAIDHGWHTVHIPAITEEGESYWPQMQALGPTKNQNNQTVLGLKCPDQCLPDPERCCWYKDLGPVNFQLVMMGNVISDETATFPRTNWRDYEILPPDAKKGAIFCDLAHSLKTWGDFTVLATVATDGTNRYWRHVVRDRMEAPEVMRALKDLRSAYPDYPIVIEDGANAKAIIQMLQKEMWGIIPFKLGNRDKMTRAQAVKGSHEAGNWFLPKKAQWRSQFIEEHAVFSPTAKHDDTVDTSTMMELYFRHGNQGRPAKKNPRPFRRAWELIKA